MRKYRLHNYSNKLIPVFAAVTFVLAAAGSKAYALSCMPPSIEASYQLWSSSEKNFIIVRGSLVPLDPLPEDPPTGNPELKPHLQAVHYHFSGINIQREKNRKFSADVMVEPKCLANWCGSYPVPTGQIITALEQIEPGHYVMRPGPCPGDYFTGNMAELEQSLRNCMNNIACQVPDDHDPVPAFKPPVTIQVR